MPHSSDSKKNNNVLAHTLLLASIILKILVVVNATHAFAKECKVGYMYEYDRDSLIVTGVMYGTLVLVMCAGGASALADAEGCAKACFALVASTIAGSLVAFIALLGKVWDSNPSTTVIFYDAFWKNPVDCPTGIDSTWYGRAQVPLKYDAFCTMVILLLLACGTCCGGTGYLCSLCSGEKKKNTDDVEQPSVYSIA